MNNNFLYLAVGALGVVAVGLGYYAYQQDQNPAPIQVSVTQPSHYDHRGHDNNRDSGHSDQHGGDHNNNAPNGHGPNE